MEEDPKIIHVALTGLTEDENVAVRMVEIFSRMLVGLALDGINVNLNVNTLEGLDEFEEEEIEGEGEA